LTKPFSDAPVKVDGVEVKPRWPWSAGYRQHVRESIRAISAPATVPDEQRIRQYVEWYADQHGLKYAEAKAILQREGRIA
jgi:hypothetical protein